MCSILYLMILFLSHFVTGVMAARGMLANPAMFAGYQNTPEQCVKDWVSQTFLL